MEKRDSLLERLKGYGESEMYPFHMPGHKRQVREIFAEGFSNPFGIDITEIDGFDNLHNPEGILKDSMAWAASVYGADRTYYLVNGSSCGILSAICGVTNNLDTILLSRNSHKSAYNGVFLNHLRAKYIYPQMLIDYGVQGGLLPDEIESMLKTQKDIHGVFVVSPTYEGVVSDIKTIATITHKYKIPLIVDEAHGAHFPFGEGLPVSALELGADVVIQSIHKTLPSLTQTALMHVREGYVDIGRIEWYLHLFQSSSPSYVFMAAIENCIRFMQGDGRRRLKEHEVRIREMRKRLGEMRSLRLLDRDVIGQGGVFDLDWSKVVISTKGTGLRGVQLDQILRERYRLEMEMCSADGVTAITTLADTGEGLLRLERALLEVDKNIAEERKLMTGTSAVGGGTDSGAVGAKAGMPAWVEPQTVMSIYDAMNGDMESIKLAESVGRICGEYIYVYPPGIPIVAPGEVLQEALLERILEYRSLGLAIQGPRDHTLNEIWVLKE